MRLTRYTDYALRVLTSLALAPERLATIDEIAGRYGISKAHRMKVVHQLGLRGVLHEALAAFLAVLDGYTLADLVARRRKPLARLLGVA